ncbi:MAG TPA: cytochrome c biogenesis CcdA family protein [Ilumatobacteraceae bacterium]
MIAIDARLATSFTAGLLAAINPCGFVLLPTYLVYFLGMENVRGATPERASMLRAVTVSLAVSAGFMSIFVVIGAITKLSTDWFVDKAQWLSLAIGACLFVLGIAMLFGYRLPFTTPRLDLGRHDRSVRSMFVFGLAYAVASIGCTITPFTGVVLGSFSTRGVRTGIIAVGLYGIGMALVVTALTVTLAFANTALLRVLRRGMAWMEQAAGVLLILTGLYLCWYWYSSITDGTGGTVVAKAGDWQSRLSGFVEDHQSAVVTIGSIIVAAAIVAALSLQRREPTP